MSGTHEHLEHAEHAQHAAHAPFDRKVAVTIAMVAALLAGVAMVGHRVHNQTLLHQTEAGVLKVQESNAWAQYQAKRLRQHIDENSAAMLKLLAGDASKEEGKSKQLGKLEVEIARYKEELKDLKLKAEAFQKAAADAEEKAHHAHKEADWLDVAHLGVEVGLVVCSIALHTKKKVYWAIGIVASLVGLALLGYGLTLKPEKHHDEAKHEEAKPAEKH